MPADKLRIRPCLLLTIAAVLGVAVGFRVIVNGYFATGVALALAVALLAAVAGLLDLLPRTASTALGAPAKMAGGILLAVGAIVPLQMGATCGPAAVAMALAPAPLYVWLALRMLRHARASRRMLLATFFWGACVAAPPGAAPNGLGALPV